MTTARRVYVISDLHIGGTYADDKAPRDERKRGFRMMTHVKELAAFIHKLAGLPNDPPVELVIAGDFIDFLAEERGSGQSIDPEAAPEWSAFRFARGEALAAFREIVKRDKVLFDALKELLEKGKRLTILLGNHDLELCLPDVRAAFEEAVGPGALRFVVDGQALDLGEVLIDHGNLFDPANVVDHERLRLVRAVYSRGRFAELDGLFPPPAGSRLVAEVMNPIKVAYGFIDLLKPESEPLFALLLALEPSYRNILADTAAALAHAARTLVPHPGLPWALRNVSAEATTAAEPAVSLTEVDAEPAPSALDALVADVLAHDADVAAALALEGTQQAELEEVSAGGFVARWSLFRLLTGRDKGELDLDRRIPQVQATLRVLVGDTSFERGIENKRYLDAAKSLATDGLNPYKVIVFGHTHHAKALTIPGTDVRYFNTGTWANLMRFPKALLDPTLTAGDVRAELFAFAKQLENNELDEHLEFKPTYLRLDLGTGGTLEHAQLYDYDWENDRLPDIG